MNPRRRIALAVAAVAVLAAAVLLRTRLGGRAVGGDAQGGCGAPGEAEAPHGVRSSALTGSTVWAGRPYTDVSPGGVRWNTSTGQLEAMSWASSSAGRILAITSSGTRVYAASPTGGLWRSSDSGSTWQQLIFASATGALPGPTVIDVSVDPGNADRVLAATSGNDLARVGGGTDGVYLSTDAGASWTLVYRPKCSGTVGAPEGVRFSAPGVAVAWGACEVAWSSAGQARSTWMARDLGSPVRQLIVDGTTNAAWACGPGAPGSATQPARLWFTSQFATLLWTDVPITSLSAPLRPGGDCSPYEQWCGGNNAWNPAFGHALALAPGNPSTIYLASNTCLSQARLWRGDRVDSILGGVRVASTVGFQLLPSPNAARPMPTGSSASGSGTVYIHTQAHSPGGGTLLLFGNADRAFVSDGDPTSASSWRQLETDRVHLDTHALALDPSFDMWLDSTSGTGEPTVFGCSGRPIWLANDGGVYRSSDCGQSWVLANGGRMYSWVPSGLSTLAARLPGFAVQPGGETALGLGTGDNGDYFSADGGQTWYVPSGTSCGDCGNWYYDANNPSWMLTISRTGLRRFGRVGAGNWQLLAEQAPRPAGIDYYLPNQESPSRHVIQTLPGESAAGYDTVWIETRTVDFLNNISFGFLVRSSDPGDAMASRTIAGELPVGSFGVQASGGHSQTWYYVWDQTTRGLLRIDPTGGWETILPRPGASKADQFFVNPYDRNEIWIVDSTSSEPGIRRWTGEGTWAMDTGATAAATVGGRFTPGCTSITCLVNDMLFVPGENTRFITGKAGVFYTTDRTTWRTLFTVDQIPSIPWGLAFDRTRRWLYVSLNGRGLLRFDLSVSANPT